MSDAPPNPANPLAEGLSTQKRPEPCTIVIFGATGDLTARKLLPAIFNLHSHDFLPQRFAIVGVARRDKDDALFRTEMGAAVREFSREKPQSDADWDAFAERLYYHRLSFDAPDDYTALAARLTGIERQLGLPGNRLYYMATAPGQFTPILTALRDHGLTGGPGGTWNRVVIEKPFGHDLASARELNTTVGQTLGESNAYRIDHYLGKETVQNVMSFRFANAIFEPLWNQRHIASVQITAAETVGMESGRGGYYDGAGAMRDMIQNHLMQLMCLVAMEPPARMEADAIRNEKVKVLRTLRPLKPDEVARNVVRGQYDGGSILGKPALAYRAEKDIPPESVTETFVAMRLRIENWRWAGVPFFLRTGKRLARRATEVAIQFHVPPVGLFETARAAIPGGSWAAPNMLILRIQPDEGIALTFDAKTPGMTMKLQPVRMDFRYGASFGEPSPEAYERLLLDAMIGDSTLFTRNDEVEASWEYITAIHTAWAAEKAPVLAPYEAGSWGPASADTLFNAGEGAWRRI